METSREWAARWIEQGPDLKARKAESKTRNKLAEAYLRPLLKAGDKLRATKAECGAKEANFKFSHWDGGWIMTTGDASIAPSMVYSVNGEVLRFEIKEGPQDEIQTVFDNPEEFTPLTEDRAVWAGFRAQRAAARALANDADAPCLGLEQCLEMSALVRKNQEVPGLALLKQLELSDVPCTLPLHCALFLVETYRCAMLNADALMAAQIAARAEPAKQPGAPKIPEDERSMQLVDDPFALTETAERMEPQAKGGAS